MKICRRQKDLKERLRKNVEGRKGIIKYASIEHKKRITSIPTSPSMHARSITYSAMEEELMVQIGEPC